MARKIDETKPLNKGDRAWLTEWGKHADIARIDAIHGQDSDSLPDEDLNDVLTGLLTKHGIAIFPGSTALATVDVALGVAAASRQTVKPVEAGFFDGEDEPAEAEDVAPYVDWLADDLRKELGSRELSKSGNKEELIARLEEDDALDA